MHSENELCARSEAPELEQMPSHWDHITEHGVVMGAGESEASVSVCRHRSSEASACSLGIQVLEAVDHTEFKPVWST